MRKILSQLAYVAVLGLVAASCSDGTGLDTSTSAAATSAVPSLATTTEAASGTTTEPEPGRLTAFTSSIYGISGLAPSGWTETSPGTASSETGAGLTQVSLPWMEAPMANRLLARSVGAPISHTGWHQSEINLWRLFSAELGGDAPRTVAAGVSDYEDGVHIVMLSAPADEHDELYDELFIPALDALEIAMPESVVGSDQWYLDSLPLFDYEPGGSPEMEAGDGGPLGDISVEHFTYASPTEGRVPASLWTPAGGGPHPAMILMHGLPGDRLQLGARAVEYARRGAVVMAIDAPHARPENADREAVTFDEQDRHDQIQLILDLRRAIDLLQARDDVIADQIAFVGVSYGAAVGGLLVGVDDRLSAAALMVGDGGLVEHVTGPDMSDSGFAQLPIEQQDRWQADMWPIEPIHFVGNAGAPLLFQSGAADTAVPYWDAVAFQRTGRSPKTVWWYEAGHELGDDDAAWEEQAAWLAQFIDIVAGTTADPDDTEPDDTEPTETTAGG